MIYATTTLKPTDLRVRIDASHLGPESDPDDLALLGMQGDLEVLVDSHWRVPLVLSGRAPGVGRVSLKLQRLTF